MRTTRPRLIFAIGILLTLLLPAGARPVRMWSPGELTQKADLIVIGTFQYTHDVNPIDLSTATRETWVPCESTFSVQAVLKGHLSGKTVTVDHYRYANKSAEISVVDGPAFIEFSAAKKNQYLIYLKQKSSTAYEPLSGQEDPGLSFSLLQPYHVTQERANTNE